MSEISTAPRNVLTVNSERRAFIGGSDAHTIMGDDESALLRLWREKRCEVESQDLSGNLVVQLGVVTEPLNRHWFERNSERFVHALRPCHITDRKRLFVVFDFRCFPEANPRPSAVLVDELDAGRFERTSNDLKRRTTWLTYSGLELMHRDNADACLPRQLLLVPSKEAACCSALCWRDHKCKVSKMSDSHNSIKNLLTADEA
jgi:hypothetical protein